MAIAFDYQTHSDDNGTPSGTWNHTCTGSNLYLVVGVCCRIVTGPEAVVATYNGVSMDRLGSQAFSVSSVVLFGLKAPATGTHAVLVSDTNAHNQNWSFGSISYTGVDQTTPTGTVNQATATSATPGVTVTSGTGQLVIDVTGNNADVDLTVTGTGQTKRTYDSAAGCPDTNMSETTGTASTVVSYSGPSDVWGSVGIPLLPVSAAPPAATINSRSTIVRDQPRRLGGLASPAPRVRTGRR